MAKVKLTALLVLLMLLASGCGNVKQINHIAFVTALGVDKTEQGVRANALVSIPGNYSALSTGIGGSKGKPTYVITEEGSTLAEAVFKMKRKSARDIKFGHMKIMLFDEAAAKEGLIPHLDLIMRREEMQIVSWIGLTRGSTKEILSIHPKLPESVSDYLIDTFSQTGSATMEILPIYSYQFYAYAREPEKSPYAMIVEKDEGQNKLKMSGLALFQSDRMVGELTQEETQDLQLLQGNELVPSSLTLPEQQATLAVLSAKSKLQVQTDRIQADVSLQCYWDQNANAGKRLTKDRLDEIEAAAEAQLTSELQQLLGKLQGKKVDPVGFAGKYRLKVNRKLNMAKWETVIFPEMESKVTVNVDIVGQGLYN